jgi:Ca-activated chloride channel family protein
MPQFAHPQLLLFALPIPLFVWLWLRCRRGALRYPGTRALARLPAGRSRLARWGGAGLRGAALFLLALALAGPRWPDLRSRLSTEGIAIAMVADVSGSMSEPDFEWQGRRITRLEAVKRAFRLFVAGGEGPDGEQFEGRPEDAIALITFAKRPDTACPLTLDHSVLLRLLDKEEPRSLPDEAETNIGDAVAWALTKLQNAGPRRKVMVLLSDGEHNEPPPALKPRQAAQLAANLHVPIYAIDAGGDAPASENQADSVTDRQQGERILQAVARISGGRSFRAHDAKTLLAVCQQIDRLERQEIQSFQYRRFHEAYAWFGLAAFGLLIGVQVLELTWWRRVP